MAYSSEINPFPGSNQTRLILYNYRPALSFNIIATVLWFLLACAHAFWLAKYRTTNIIQSLFVSMALWEFALYILRCVNHDNPFRGNLFIGQYVSNIVAANGIIAAIQLGCLHGVRVNEPMSAWSRFKAPMIRNIFMALNAITAIWQLVASAMLGRAEFRAANGDSTSYSRRSANRALLASFAFQVAHLTAFQAIVTYLLIKSLSKRNHTANAALNRQTTNNTTATGETAVATPATTVRPAVKTFLFLVFLTIGMLWMRSIYRLVETAQGFYGKAHSSEALYGVFEFAPVWTAAAIWAIKPFGRWLLELATDAFHHHSHSKGGINPSVA